MTAQLEKAMAAYNGAYLDMINRKYGGDTTLNEMRVMNCIFRANLAGRNIGVSCVARALRIPKSTVSRAVLKFRGDGWIDEIPSPSDGRRRYLRLSSKVVDQFAAEFTTLHRLWPYAA